MSKPKRKRLEPSKELLKMQEDIGQRLKEIRLEAFDNMNQTQFGEEIPHLHVVNKQSRIYHLENGAGSAQTIYAVLSFLYRQGININYLFSEHEPMKRTIDRENSVYSGNILEFLDELLANSRSAEANLRQISVLGEEFRDFVASELDEKP